MAAYQITIPGATGSQAPDGAVPHGPSLDWLSGFGRGAAFLRRQ